MRDEALIHAVDPASDRLTHAAVIDIHKCHAQDVPWDVIAQRYNITRKNVQRIVQGRRWADLHPVNRPDLYEERPREDADEAAYKQGFLDAVNAIEALVRDGVRKPDDWRERAVHSA